MTAVCLIPSSWLKALRGGLGRGLGEGRRVGVLGDTRSLHPGVSRSRPVAMLRSAPRPAHGLSRSIVTEDRALVYIVTLGFLRADA